MDTKLKIIEELMKQLQEEMEYGKDDFDERLGRKKPDVEVISMEMPEKEDEEEVEMPMDEFQDEHERLVKTLRSPSHKDDMEEADEQEHELEEESSDDSLVKRLMKLRK